MAVKVYDKEQGTQFGELTEEQFALLREHLEEESSHDDDYYINADTIDLLREAGADEGLLGILRAALGDREDCELGWRRE